MSLGHNSLFRVNDRGMMSGTIVGHVTFLTYSPASCDFRCSFLPFSDMKVTTGPFVCLESFYQDQYFVKFGPWHLGKWRTLFEWGLKIFEPLGLQREETPDVLFIWGGKGLSMSIWFHRYKPGTCPLLKWKIKVSNKNEMMMKSQAQDSLVNNEPRVWQDYNGTKEFLLSNILLHLLCLYDFRRINTIVF